MTAPNRTSSPGQRPGQSQHGGHEDRWIVENHIHFDLAPLVSLLTEVLHLLEEIKRTMAVATVVQSAIDALKASAKADSTAETAQVIAAIQAAGQGAQDTITALQAQIVTLQEQLAAGQDPTETVASIAAAAVEVSDAIKAIVPDAPPVPEPVPNPTPESRRR